VFGLDGRTGHVSFRLLHVLEFRDGKISRENVWSDVAAIAAQTEA
jgi:predicted ester cyclase